MSKRSVKQAGGASSDTAADKEIDVFVRRVAEATPIERVALERQGVTVSFLRALAVRLGISVKRIFEIIGLPHARHERRRGDLHVTGSAGHAALALVDLLSRAQEIVAQTTSDRAERFDVAKWLGQWIELPQPVLGGRRPADLIGTPTGVVVVSRLLGAAVSGTYQ